MRQGRVGLLSQLHAFPKPERDIVQQTAAGAVVTILGLLTAVTLFAHELSFYVTPTRDYKMQVDTTTRGAKLPLNFDIEFPAMPCQAVSLAVMDASGKRDVNTSTTQVLKVRLSGSGRPVETHTIADLRHAAQKDRLAANASAGLLLALKRHKAGNAFNLFDLSKLDSTVKEIKDALARHEGCRVSGQLSVERIAGHLQVSVQAQHFYVLQKVFPSAERINMSHVIHTLGFGVIYPGIENPLDRVARVIHPHTAESDFAGDPEHTGDFKYFLKVVPTRYKYLSGAEVDTNQYSVSEYFHAADPRKPGILPALSFIYDISPITVSITEERQNFFHFLTRLCAVIGGALTLTGVFNRLVHSVLKQLVKPRSRTKLVLPKLS